MLAVVPDFSGGVVEGQRVFSEGDDESRRISSALFSLRLVYMHGAVHPKVQPDTQTLTVTVGV